MNIPELKLLPMYLNQVHTRGGVIPEGVSNFTSMLNSMLVAQSVSIQEHVKDTVHDCEETEKCKCDSDDETAEMKKTGFAACMDCVGRKAGTCALWNGKEGILDMLLAMSHDSSMDKDMFVAHKQVDFQPNVAAIDETWLDYNNAYAYITKKQLGILMPD